MTRVSLKEAYDNKDVVAQIYAIRDIAEGASDTADSAKTTADDAKTYVDTLGVQVEGAVQTANNASTSAQASAQTVAGYENRLTVAEGAIDELESDVDGLETGLGAVTARVTTAEGNIITIQGRVTALETADGQNVKINSINEYAVGLTGNQTVLGQKTFAGGVYTVAKTFTVSRTLGYHRLFRFNNANTKQITMLVGDRYDMCVAHVTLSVNTEDPTQVTATGNVQLVSTPIRTEFGIMYDPDDDGYYCVINRVSGGNIYTSGLIVSITEGTSSNPVYVQTEDTVLASTPQYYAGVAIL